MSFSEDIYESNYNDHKDFEQWIPEGSSQNNIGNIGGLGLALYDNPVFKKTINPINAFHYDIHKKSGAICFPTYFNENLENFLPILTKFKKIWFFKYFNQSVDILPDSVEELRLGGNFSQTINKYPSGLKKLVLFSDIQIDNLPNLEVLHLLGNFINTPINNLPDSIKEIYIGGDFNQPIDNLPNSLTKLQINDTYTSACPFFRPEIRNLPNTITHLTIKTQLDKPIVLPDSLEYLEIHFDGNYLPRVLPPNLKVLKLLGEFNSSIEGILPEGLEELQFGPKFNCPLGNESGTFIPSTLKKLSNYSSNFGMYVFSQDINNLPDNIQEINLHFVKYFGTITKLPSNLKKFILTNNTYPSPSDNKNILVIDSFPSGIEEIDIFMQDNISIPKIPDSCKILDLNIFVDFAPKVLPNNLEVFRLNCTSIESLIKSNKTPYPVYDFPPTLINLTIDELDLRKTTLPTGLVELTINSKCWLINLPDTIEILVLERLEYIDKLPNNIKKIYSHISNQDLIEPLLNPNIEYKKTGLLERSYGVRSYYESI